MSKQEEDCLEEWAGDRGPGFTIEGLESLSLAMTDSRVLAGQLSGVCHEIGAVLAEQRAQGVA